MNNTQIKKHLKNDITFQTTLIQTLLTHVAIDLTQPQHQDKLLNTLNQITQITQYRKAIINTTKNKNPIQQLQQEIQNPNNTQITQQLINKLKTLTERKDP